MARLIARGPRPPSRAALLGEQAGSAFANAFAPAFTRGQLGRQRAEALNPFIFGSPAEQAQQAMGTMPQPSARIQILQRMLSDPNAAAEILSNDQLFAQFLEMTLPEEAAREKLRAGEVLVERQQGGAFQEVARGPEKPAQPQTPLGKLKADFTAGLIDRDEFLNRRRELLRPDRDIRSGPGGSFIDTTTGEVLVPGQINVVDSTTGQERTVIFRTKEELSALQNAFSTGQFVQTTPGRPVTPDEPASDLLDARGNVKQEVSAEIRRQSVQLFGGSINPLTGAVENLSTENARRAQSLAVNAEALIRSGQAHGVAEAVQGAAGVVGLPEVRRPQVQVPEEQRNELLAQNNEISSVLTLAETRLPQIPLATGAVSGLFALLDMSIGQIATLFGRNQPLFPDTQEARQAVREFNQSVKRAIINNPRFPVAEQEIVREMLPDPNSVFTNPPAAALKFRQLLEFLREKQAANTALLQGQRPTPTAFSTPEAVMSAPLDQVRRFAESLDEATANSLPPGVSDAIVRRLQQEQ